jgi:prolyl-tRNA editing enzyme YbaK/EbsC (Cys-tRNA(Pro) deacylase)
MRAAPTTGSSSTSRRAGPRSSARTYVSFAAPQIAEELSGSVMGGVIPFTFDERLELIVDPALLRQEELYTNAARLDRSIALRTRDYVRIAKPRFEGIAQRGASSQTADLSPADA